MNLTTYLAAVKEASIVKTSVADPQHILGFGDPGSGKSTLVSKLTSAGFRLWWLSLDRGHKILEKLPEEAKARVELFVIPDTRDFPMAYQVVRELVKGRKQHLCDIHGTHNCGTCTKANASFSDIDPATFTPKDILVIDHGSQVGDSCMNVVCKNKAIDYKPQLDDWGSLKFFLTEIGLAIQAAPFHIVMLAHVVETKMEDGRIKLTPQVGSAETSKMFSKYFDHVFYCEVVNKSHKAGSSSTYHMSAVTKSRTDVAIEAGKDQSLVPFFVSSEKEKEKDKEVAKPILQEAVKAVTAGVVTAPITAQTVSQKQEQVAPPKVEEQKVVSTIETSKLSAGATTSLTAVSAATPAANSNPAQDAKALLARLSAKKK